MTGDEVFDPGPSKVLFIGNPIEDLYARVEDSVVSSLDVNKGEYRNVTREAFDRIGERVGVDSKNAGGSSANTSRAYCYLGGLGTFIGACGPDLIGEGFKRCLREYGVDTSRIVTRPEGNTNRIYCLVTPDSERTMYVLCGVAGSLCLADVPRPIMHDYDYFAINALNFDYENRVQLSHTMVEETLKLGKGLITLFANLTAVNRSGKYLRPIADKSMYLSGNIEEYYLLYSISDKEELFQTFEKKTAGERPQHKAVIITMSGDGAMIIYHGGRYFVEASAPGADVVDTTGAGDFFAGAMLYGLLNGYTVKTSAEFAKTLVGDIITKMGTLLDDSAREKVNAIKAGVGRP